MESKREEFRKYLEKAGALQALSYALAHLYEMPEKPMDPLLFIQESLKHCVDGGKLDEMPLPLPLEPIGQADIKAKDQEGVTEERFEKC